MVTIRLPQGVSGVTSATVRRWRVAPGQAFAAGALLVELDAESSLVHVTAPQAGSLASILAPVGATVATGGELAQLGDISNRESRISDLPASQTTAAATAGTASAPKSEIQNHKSEISSSPVRNPAMTSANPATPILMPQAGNTMEEGRILEWKVKEGDTITAGQVLCEIETDKATMEFESPVAGKLGKIVVPNGEAAPVKTPIAFLADGDIPSDGAISNLEFRISDLPTSQTASTPPAGAASDRKSEIQNPKSEIASTTRPAASPAARKAASAQGIDLASAAGAGSGPGGRILSTDVAKMTPSASPAPGSAPAARPVAASAPAPAPTAQAAAAAAAPAAPLTGDPGTPTRRPMSKMRRAIGLNLQQSKQTVPHFYVRQTIDAGPLLAFYKALKPLTGCSINDVLLMVLARTMREFPAFRSRLEGDTIVEYPAANIGIAVGIDDGLVVPVVLGMDRLSLAQMAQQTKRVVENARKGKLENIGKSSFTISNLGMFGVEEFAAIINPPEAGILAVSGIREDVVVKNGAIRAAQVMTLTLSADHRIVDGLLAAQFMAKFKTALEAPENCV